MIEIKGWISIWGESDGEDFTEPTREIIEQIRALLKAFNGRTNEFFHLAPLNGEYTLWFGIDHNHDIASSHEILQLLNNISKIAIGSYGISYMRWSDDENKDENKYYVYRLARGVVTEHDDVYLSPCSTVFESI